MDQSVDQNKINGKEIAVLKVKSVDGKYNVPEVIPFIIASAEVEKLGITDEAMKCCVKQLEAMGSFEELSKEYGYRNEGEKSNGLVIGSKKDPRICCSVEFGGKFVKDSDAQFYPTSMEGPFKQDLTLKFFIDDENLKANMGDGAVPERPVTPEELEIPGMKTESVKLSRRKVSESIDEAKGEDSQILVFLNKVADALVDEGFDVEQPKKGMHHLDIWKSGARKKGFVEIYFAAPSLQGNKVTGGIFTWTHGENEDEDIEVNLDADGDVTPYMLGDLVGALSRSFDFEIPGMKTESRELVEAEEKPIEREVTIELTLREAADALGYLSGRDAWKIQNDYLDADSFDDVWHDGYSVKNVQSFFEPKGMDGVAKIFPYALARAAEDSERDGYAAAITKARHQAIEDSLEKIDVTGKYMSGDGEMIAVKGAAVTKVVMDVPGNKVEVTIKNPEHLINDIVNGVGMFAPELDPYEKASDEEIKQGFINVAGDYFSVYGESKSSAELGSQFQPDRDEDFYKEVAENEIAEMSIEEIAEAVVDAVDDGRIKDEKEAGKLAAKLSGKKFKQVMDAVAKAHKGSSEKYAARAIGAEVPEEESKGTVGNMTESRINPKRTTLVESRKNRKQFVNLDPTVDPDFAELISESIQHGGMMEHFSESVEAVDAFGFPTELSETLVSVKAIGDKPISTKFTGFNDKDFLVHDDPESMDKEVEGKVKELKGEEEPNKAGEAIAKPDSVAPIGVKSGEKEHPESALKTGDAKDGNGEVMQGSGKSDDQQKDLPSNKIKLGKVGDDHGKIMGESLITLSTVCEALIKKGLKEEAQTILNVIKAMRPIDEAKMQARKRMQARKGECEKKPEMKESKKKSLTPEQKAKLKARWSKK